MKVKRKQARKPFLADILERIAPSIGARVFVEPNYGFVGLVSFANGRTTLFWESRLDINTVAAARVAQDKGYASMFLRQAGIRTPTEQCFYSDQFAPYVDPARGLEGALEFAQYIGFPVYVKPNRLSQGRLVECVHTASELTAAARAIFMKDRVMLVQSPCVGRDWRITVLDGCIIDAYERIPLTVVGDGVTSILRLLNIQQQRFRADGRDTVIDTRDRRVLNNLSRAGKTLDSILAPDEQFRLHDVANLSLGGQARSANVLHPSVRHLAAKVARILNLRFCGIDLIADSLSDDIGDSYIVLEVNSAPGLDAYLTADGINHADIDGLYTMLLRAIEQGPPTS